MLPTAAAVDLPFFAAASFIRSTHEMFATHFYMEITWQRLLTYPLSLCLGRCRMALLSNEFYSTHNMRLRCDFFLVLCLAQAASCMLFRCSFYPISLLVILMIMAQEIHPPVKQWRWRWFDAYDFCVVNVVAVAIIIIIVSILRLSPTLALLCTKYPLLYEISVRRFIHSLSLSLVPPFRHQIDSILLISNEQEQQK